VNPLVTTLGGVFGPIVVYFILLNIFDAAGAFDDRNYDYDDLTKGWGITTATDISLGWATALMVFGSVDRCWFLLLLVCHSETEPQALCLHAWT
jgi:NhaA family Na+:H+ antiporter